MGNHGYELLVDPLVTARAVLPPAPTTLGLAIVVFAFRSALILGPRPLITL